MLSTECNNCRHRLPVSAFQLRQAGGIVVCPHCRKVFNALPTLADEDTGPSEQGPAGGATTNRMPPVLEKLADAALEVSEPATAEPQATYGIGMPEGEDQGFWSPAAAVLVAALPVLIALLVWQIWTMPSAQSGKVDPAMADSPAAASFRIVSRDLHRHPTRVKFGMLSFRLRNISDRPRQLPDIEVSAPSSQPLPAGAYRLRPEVYARVANATVAPGGEDAGLVTIKAKVEDGGLDVRIR